MQLRGPLISDHDVLIGWVEILKLLHCELDFLLLEK